MNQTVLAAVLARANGAPPMHFREQFYEVKQHIVARWGSLRGLVYQRIEDRCWGEHGNLCDRYCGKCGGTGIYRALTVELEEWELEGRVFHRPLRRVLYTSQPIAIHGRVHHRRIVGARDCAGALFLLFAPHLVDLHVLTPGGSEALRRAMRIAAAIGPVPRSSVIRSQVPRSSEIPF